MESVPDKCRKLHIQVGKENRVAFVFSCPGRHEEIAGHPAAKGTGRNLEILLSILSHHLSRSDLTRENITITNVWPEVEYKEKTGRSEATIREIRAPANVERLRQELEVIADFIVFCGDKAAAVAALLRLRLNPKLVFISHPGLRGLSLINSDLCGDPIIAAELQLIGGSPRRKREIQQENTRKRLEVLAHSILRQLGRSHLPPGEGQGEGGGWN